MRDDEPVKGSFVDIRLASNGAASAPMSRLTG
jgi:hypothetical protein